MNRWTRVGEGKPPLNGWGRCDDLWLYDAMGADVVYEGFYVETGDEADDSLTDRYSHEGELVKPTHWALIWPGEYTEPSPPFIR